MIVERKIVDRDPVTGRTREIYVPVKGAPASPQPRGISLAAVQSLNANRGTAINHGRMRGNGLAA